MEIANQRRILTGLAGGMLACAVGATTWSLGGISETPLVAEDDSATEVAVISPQDPASKIPEVDLSVALSRSLHDKPKPPPPPVRTSPPPTRPAVVAKPPRKPKLDWTLVGTLIQADASVAMIADATGKVEIARIGQPLDLSPAGVTVEEIDSQKVTLRYEGQDSVVRLKQSFNASGNTKPRRGGKGRPN